MRVIAVEYIHKFVSRGFRSSTPTHALALFLLLVAALLEFGGLQGGDLIDNADRAGSINSR